MPSADHAADLFADLQQHQLPLRQDGAHGVEIVNHAVVTNMFHGNAGRRQLSGVGVALVAHRVEFGGMDNGGGKPGQIISAKWGNPDIGRVGAIPKLRLSSTLSPQFFV